MVTSEMLTREVVFRRLAYCVARSIKPLFVTHWVGFGGTVTMPFAD